MDDKGKTGVQPARTLPKTGRLGQLSTLVLVTQIIFAAIWFNPFLSSRFKSKSDLIPLRTYHCTPPPIPVEFLGGISADDRGFAAAGQALNRILSLRVQAADMDSMSLAIVTPTEILFQKSYGLLKANETSPEKRGRPDENTLYRIASISKMFAAFEMMLLRESGVLSLDDPVTRFLPNFTYLGAGWEEHLDAKDHMRLWSSKPPPITLRQLASHMSGIGRDYPPMVLKGYPHVDINTTMTIPSRTPPETLHSIATLPLVAEPYTYPIYSNTGFSLLGWTLVAAANRTSSYADLIQRDIFSPLGLSSSFNVTKDNAKNVAISREPTEADLDFGEGMNSAGGQFSSLSDLTTVMQTFLDPRNNKKALLSPYAMREWTRPLHGWDDGLSEVGAPWEITKMPDSNGVPRRFFGKSGNLYSYHSYFSFDPTHASYGVIVLMTGSYPMAGAIAAQAMQIFQPTFDRIIARATQDLYAGKWESEDKTSVAVTYVYKGNVWLRRLILDGTDMFKLLAQFGRSPPAKKTRYGLWTTGRKDEFRVAVGLPEPHDYALEGCMPAWASLDGVYGKNAPIDLVLFGGDLAEGRTMRIPSSGTILKRKPLRHAV